MSLRTTRAPGRRPAVAAVALQAAAFGFVASNLAGCASRDVPEPRPTAASPDASDLDRRARARLELAEAYLARNQTDTALDEIRLALQARPDMAEAHALRALILAARDDRPGADASFARARSLAPRSGSVAHNHGWYLCQTGRHKEAQQAFEDALATPGYRDVARTQLSRGICFGRAGRWLEAEGALTRSINIDPGNPFTAYNLADVLLRRGELDRARAYIAQVNDNDGARNAQSLWLAVRIERAAGRADAARALGNQLVRQFAQSQEAARWERGQFDE